MPYYETVFIARQDISQSQVDELTKDFSKFITDKGGKITKTKNWGLRNLAFKIDKNRKGYYVLIESDTPSEGMLEMERNMRLNEDVLRYMTVRLDELSDGPSVMMSGETKKNKEAA